MITRLWRGWTTPGNADAYERFLLDDPFPSMRRIPEFDGAVVLRREEAGKVGFVTLTRFESLDAIRALAGEDYETPVLEPQARAVLSRSTSAHRITTPPLSDYARNGVQNHAPERRADASREPHRTA